MSASVYAVLADQAILPDPIEEEEPTITECYLVGDVDNPSIVDGHSLLAGLLDNVTMQGIPQEQILKEVESIQDIQKSVDGSKQDSTLSKERKGLPLNELKVVEPPYSPEIIKLFSHKDETNFRCIAAKSQDSVGRAWTLEVEKSLKTTPQQFDTEDLLDEARLKIAAEQIKEASTFLNNCNHVFGLDGVLLKAAMDLESVGWAAIEVIRSADMKVHSLDYAPAEKIRVVEGWKGFVELREGGKKVYYQPFGQKVLSKKRIDPMTQQGYPYSPDLDGELTPANAEFNMISYVEGKPTTDFTTSANEIIWIVKHHPSTLHYGISDAIPILPKILINMNINQYALQFFEHNTVPRYVIIIKGAKLDSDVKDAILNYFQTEVKGRAHKTLILPLPTGRGNVEVTFQKLDADNQDGWFRETYKDNANSIRIAHGVTAAIIGQSETASLGSGKGLSQAEIYKDRVVVPNQQKWSSILNGILSTGRGLNLVCVVFAEIDTRDHESKMRVWTGHQDRGTVSINEVRAACGLGGPITGGDRPFIKIGNAILFVDEIVGMKSTIVNPLEMAKLQVEAKAKLQAGGDNRGNKPPEKAPENTAIQTVDRGAQA